MFSIVPYRYSNNHPVRRNTEVRDPFNAFADSFFRSFWGDESASTFKVDVEDKGDHYCLEADLPGMDKDHVHVDVENGILTISAEMNEQNDKNESNYVLHERRYGSVSRSFQLEGVEEQNITGEYKDGVLRMNLPKHVEQPKSNTRRIELQ